MSAAVSREDRFVDLIVAQFCRADGPYAGQEDLHRPRLTFEFNTGQWTMLTSKQYQLWGWMSWYRCNDEVIEALRTGEQDEWIRQGRLAVLTEGPHCYIASSIVTPAAPAGTYRRLFDLVCEANKDAASISAHLIKRDGRSRFMQRFNDGTPDWYEHCQSDWSHQHG